MTHTDTLRAAVLDQSFANTPPIDWSEHEWSLLAATLSKPEPAVVVKEKLFWLVRKAWFDGRGSPKGQYDSEAVEAGWQRDIDRLLAETPLYASPVPSGGAGCWVPAEQFVALRDELDALKKDVSSEAISPPDAREEGLFVICKYGGYYRPNATGYTNNIAEAGRYTLAEAISHSHPNGPDGPRDGITYEPAPKASSEPCPPDARVVVEACAREIGSWGGAYSLAYSNAIRSRVPNILAALQSGASK